LRGLLLFRALRSFVHAANRNTDRLAFLLGAIAAAIASALAGLSCVRARSVKRKARRRPQLPSTADWSLLYTPFLASFRSCSTKESRIAPLRHAPLATIKLLNFQQRLVEHLRRQILVWQF
jgi:hypothetical protein